MNKHTPPAPPTLPVLSPSLLTTFGSLSGGERRIFKRLYLALWRFLWPVSRLDGVALGYTIPRCLVELNPRLSISSWFMLSRLYILTGGGATAIDSRMIHFNSYDREVIRTLMNHKFVIRTSFDPEHPYLRKASHINLTYISLTPPGLSFFRVVVKKINQSAYLDTLAACTGPKEKGQ